jgi:hypothetical protein
LLGQNAGVRSHHFEWRLTVRRFWSAAVCAITILLPIAVDAANFTGSWAVSGALQTPDGPMTISPVCTFKQDGDRITGTCKGPSYLGSAEGAVDGQHIVWHWYGVATNDVQRPNVTTTFKGTLESDGFIRGSWTNSNVPEGVSGDFTAQKVK